MAKKPKPTIPWKAVVAGSIVGHGKIKGARFSMTLVGHVTEARDRTKQIIVRSFVQRKRDHQRVRFMSKTTR